jgi:hypothetical protein
MTSAARMVDSRWAMAIVVRAALAAASSRSSVAPGFP